MVTVPPTRGMKKKRNRTFLDDGLSCDRRPSIARRVLLPTCGPSLAAAFAFVAHASSVGPARGFTPIAWSNRFPTSRRRWTSLRPLGASSSSSKAPAKKKRESHRRNQSSPEEKVRDDREDTEIWDVSHTMGSVLLQREKEEEELMKKDANGGGDGTAPSSFWSTASSMGSYLLKRKREEEGEMERFQKQRGDDGITGRAAAPAPDDDDDDDREGIVPSAGASVTGTEIDGMGDETASTEADNEAGFEIDPKLAQEIDDSITPLSNPGDIEMLPIDGNSPMTNPQTLDSEEKVPTLPLSVPSHYKDRIGRDMRHLAVSVSSSIDDPWQWKLFFDEGGGVLPLLECIRDGALSVERGGADFLDGDKEGMESLMAQHEVSFAAACTACRALRDLSALSKEFSAVVTDDIMKIDAEWSLDNSDCRRGGLLSHLVVLLRHANDAEKLYSGLKMLQSDSQAVRTDRRGFDLGNIRSRRDARRRCGLYVVQLLLSMAVASDAAVNALRSTPGLRDAVIEASSYAPKERRRQRILYPVEFVKKRVFRRNKGQRLLGTPKVRGGLPGKVQGTANKLLAAIGYNKFAPKSPGQKGLRILCIDGGGTRGIAAVTALRSIVEACGGIEVCDAFDMIVGTSTGAIVSFLVGIRRESAKQARARYDALIKRIFIKSSLSTLMLATTTASYDEGPLMEVLNEILGDNGMLDSRADPAVPLVFAISSKMSSTPSQLCLMRNYNYGGGEIPDRFVIDPDDARQELSLKHDDVMESITSADKKRAQSKHWETTLARGSRYPGSFRVTQKVALRATTAAPTFFKPLLSFDELYVDGGMVVSNPAAVAIHEARTLFPDVPIELIVSVGTGGFTEQKVPPRVGWDGVLAQVLDSATDSEQVHHFLEDVFGEGSTVRLSSSPVSHTRYFRLNPKLGTSKDFPIDETDPVKLEELCQIVERYMKEEEQVQKLKEIGNIVKPKRRWRLFPW